MSRPSKTLLLILALFLLVVGVWSRHTMGQRFEWADQIEMLVYLRGEIMRHYVEEPDEEAMMQAAARGMVAALKDPYTTYLAPEDLSTFDREVRGTFSGIGAEVMLDPDLNRVKIVSPLEDSPAWNAGVLAGDIILTIDGQSTEDMSLEEAVEKLVGEEGTQVVITVRHESGEEEKIAITRARINVHTVKGLRRDAENHWQFLVDPEHQIGYVRLSQFNENTADDLRQVLEGLKAQGLKGLILDVRFNPGGLLGAAVEVADMFLPEGKTIVSIKGRNMPEQIYRSTSDTILPEIPIVILANGQSASASEILAGALADHDRAQFIGTRTFGKGSVQEVSLINRNARYGAVKLTTALYYIPSGRKIHRLEDSTEWGVDPEEGFYVPMSNEAFTQMVEARRENDILRKVEEQGLAKVTPEFIEQEMHDPQLAAGLRAMLGRLADGQWTPVAEGEVDVLAMQEQRQELMRQRDFLQERLAEIDTELKELEAGKVDEEAAAEAEDAAAEAPDAEDAGEAEEAAEVPAVTPTPTAPEPGEVPELVPAP